MSRNTAHLQERCGQLVERRLLAVRAIGRCLDDIRKIDTAIAAIPLNPDDRAAANQAVEITNGILQTTLKKL